MRSLLHRCGLVGLWATTPIASLAAQMPLLVEPAARPEWQVVSGWDEVPLIGVRRASRPRGGPQRPSRLVLSAAAPVRLVLSGEHWTLGAGLERTRRFANGWGVGTSSSLSLTRANSLVARATGLGLEFAALPGRYGTRGAVALDLRWRAALLTHLAHRAPARALFDDRYAGAAEGPPDGVLPGGGSRVQLGIAAGRRFGADVTLAARLGVMAYPGRPTVLVNPMLGQLPFYFTVGVGRTW